jgi:hypothetical protein
MRIYFSKSRFLLNGGYIVFMELLLGHEKIITKSGISLNAGTLNRGFTVCNISCKFLQSMVVLKYLFQALI